MSPTPTTRPLPSGWVAVVPETCRTFPIRMFLEYPISGSKGEVPAKF